MVSGFHQELMKSFVRHSRSNVDLAANHGMQADVRDDARG